MVLVPADWRVRHVVHGFRPPYQSPLASARKALTSLRSAHPFFDFVDAAPLLRAGSLSELLAWVERHVVAADADPPLAPSALFVAPSLPLEPPSAPERGAAAPGTATTNGPHLPLSFPSLWVADSSVAVRSVDGSLPARSGAAGGGAAGGGGARMQTTTGPMLASAEAIAAPRVSSKRTKPALAGPPAWWCEVRGPWRVLVLQYADVMDPSEAVRLLQLLGGVLPRPVSLVCVPGPSTALAVPVAQALSEASSRVSYFLERAAAQEFTVPAPFATPARTFFSILSEVEDKCGVRLISYNPPHW